MWWERRDFPLKDEDTEVLLCQDKKNDQIESSSLAFSGEVFCTSAPENGQNPKRQADGMEEYKTYAVGLSHVKKKIGDKEQIKKMLELNGKQEKK